MSKNGISKEYDRYLRGAEWKAIREKVLQRDGRRCRQCGSPGCTHNYLTVHHLHYRNIFREKLEDLQTLCLRCHMATDGGRFIRLKSHTCFACGQTAATPPPPPKKSLARKQRRLKAIREKAKSSQKRQENLMRWAGRPAAVGSKKKRRKEKKARPVKREPLPPTIRKRIEIPVDYINRLAPQESA